MEDLVKVRKVGGSLMVVVPKEIVASLGVEANTKLRVDFKKPRLDFFGKYKGVGEFTQEDRFDVRED